MSRIAFAAILVAAMAVAGCSASHPAPSSAMNMSDMGGMGDMPGMSAAPTAKPLAEATPDGTGLAGSVGAYSLVADTHVLASEPGLFAFHIAGPGGHAVTRYQPYRSKLMLFDVIRADLTQYQHFDAAMRQDGTWNVALPALPPGSYRAYATFATPDASQGKPLVYQLSAPFTVGGTASDTALPQPASTVSVGGYTVRLSGQPSTRSPTALTIGFSKDGKEVPYFQRYLDGYADVTAFREGSLAAAHLTPATRVSGQSGTSDLTTQALFPVSGTWRLFVQFQVSGPVQTAAFTIDVP
jgi:hypothetical protein